jgi:hypothetical protein
LLIVLRKAWPTKLKWGATVADVVDGVLCLGWQDNNFVLGLSTVHTIHEASSWVTSKRNCPSKTSTNANITREVFGDSPSIALDIPTFIDDYNHHMNSVDLANQHRQPYDTQKIAYQTWIPLLHWILDQAAINAYKIAIISKTWSKDDDSAHLEFRRLLYEKLLDYSKLVDPQLWKEPGLHKWTDRPTQQACVMCCKRNKLERKFIAEQEAVGIRVFKPSSGPKRPSQCRSGCGYCDVALCRMGTCFSDWHAQKG